MCIRDRLRARRRRASRGVRPRVSLGRGLRRCATRAAAHAQLRSGSLVQLRCMWGLANAASE
eukprot:11309903-Alexandrium_andersonii.AAC.1